MTLPSGLPDTVADAEDLARFLTSSGHYNSTVVKPAAFMPNPRNGETSVYRHGADPLEGLVNIAREEIGAERKVHGAAVVKAAAVRAAQLEARAGEPPPRHADIVGWPWYAEDPDFGKAAQKELAAAIAQKAGTPVRLTV